MRNVFISLKISRVYLSIMVLILSLLVLMLGKRWCNNVKETAIDNTIARIETSKNDNLDKTDENLAKENIEIIEGNFAINTIEEDKKEIVLEEYKTMPRELEGYKVIGKIQIPKINLEFYILSETNKDTLKISVTKLCGPEINEVGNFCIAGHNYNKFFAKIKNLDIKDNIILTDKYDRSITYEVYDIFQTSPKDISCLNQDTEGERELTLITCSNGAIKRFIVKAIEVYD